MLLQDIEVVGNFNDFNVTNVSEIFEILSRESKSGLGMVPYME